jgi:hypothetical protein
LILLTKRGRAETEKGVNGNSPDCPIKKELVTLYIAAI